MSDAGDNSEKLLNIEMRLSQLETAEKLSTEPPKFWNINARIIVQTLVGGIVAGALIWGFALDNLLKLQQSSEMQRLEVVEREKKLKDQLALQETRQEILNHQSDALREDRLQSTPRPTPKPVTYLPTAPSISDPSKFLHPPLPC